MARKRLKIGSILQERGVVDDRQINEAQRIASGTRKKIGEALVDLGYVLENDIAKALATQFDLEFVDLDVPNAVNKDNLSLLPTDLVKKHQVLPVEKTDTVLHVIVSDPMNLAMIDDLRFRLNCDIQLSVAAKGKIREYIDKFAGGAGTIDDEIAKATMDASMDASMDLSLDRSMDSSLDSSMDRGGSIDVGGRSTDGDDPNATPIIKLVNEIIKEAVMSRVSDIHVEPFEDRVRLRYRIDGVCHEKNKIPKRTQGAVTTRLKILAGVKIEEKRIPQDGRIKMKVAGEVVDFRASFCPAYHGESIVLRILRPDAAKLGLPSLGMMEDTLELFNDTIRKPNGIFLVTGPTGSGKTTPLYSALADHTRPDNKIITAEDPIEYNFKGINQCQVNTQIGLTFQIILKSMLRQAPNVILVGEIRDKEVGEVAIQAALTGHLVFSTLHTNDAPSAITRLVDMGLKPFLVASSIQAVLAQRLVRILCEHCKAPEDDPDRKLLAICDFKPGELEGQTIYKAVGCARCGQTGYRGRKGIYEYMKMNGEIRELAFQRAPVNELRQAAIASGMRNLLGDGKLKILNGMTTLEEIARITQIEGIAEVEEEEAVAG